MRIVAVDLETTGLSGIMGVTLCGSFLEIVPPGFYRNHRGVPPRPYTIKLDRNDKNRYDPNPDHKLVVALRDEIEKYDCIVTWNGKMFDVPFLNARLAFFGERPVRPQFHIDLMYYAGGVSMRIGSRKLVNVEKYFKLGDSTEGGKTEIDWDTWRSAALGSPDAMREVVHHCEQDVRVLAEAYWHLLPYVANIHK